MTITAFRKKIVDGQFRKVMLGKFQSFPDFVARNDVNVTIIKSLINAYLKSYYFPELLKDLPIEHFRWILYQFAENKGNRTLSNSFST